MVRRKKSLNAVLSRLQRIPTLHTLLLLDLIVSIVFILVEPTYVFDWDAYMEQVAQVKNGEYDYQHIHGATGPVVYPAGFIWLFMLFKTLFQWDHTVFTTEYIPKNFTLEIEIDPETYRSATNYDVRTVRPTGRILALQLMFTMIYLVGNQLMGSLYQQTKTMPWWSLYLLMCSRRIHSIFVLGLFNDCWAQFLLIVSIYYFVQDRWETGCVFFSLAVSIKMNILLFAPSLLILMCQRYNVKRAIGLIGLCALVQFVVAFPFLLRHPFHYIKGAFDLSRQFFQKWSVNWQFLPEWLFLNKLFALGLLSCQLVTLYMFAEHRWTNKNGVLGLFTWRRTNHRGKKDKDQPLQVQHILTVLLTGNFIGIVFCRSLHYQFYSWYFFSVPYLLWRTNLPTVVKLGYMLAIEISWNQHPPLMWSSALLQITHCLILLSLWNYSYDEKRTTRYCPV